MNFVYARLIRAREIKEKNKLALVLKNYSFFKELLI